MPAAFSEAFRFGIGDSDLQVIGEEHCLREEGAEPSMWTAFCNRNRCWNGDSPLRGVDRYHRWQEDVDLVDSMGIRHFRTSISACRLLHRDGSPNRKAVDWYRRFLGALKSRGIRTYATLYHWELPAFLQEEGGWTQYRTVEFMGRHAATACRELGDLIDEYFTINEPWCVSFLGHHTGVHAPGIQSLSAALSAAHHLMLANSVMANELWHQDPSIRAGIVLSTLPCYAMSSTSEDLRAVRLADAACNGWFLDPLFLGRYPSVLEEWVEPHMPAIGPADMQQIAIGSRLHFVGINNYYGLMVEHDPDAELQYRSCLLEDAPTNDLGWPIFMPPYYPSGLYDMLHQVYHSYRHFGLKRLYVSENGMAEKPTFDSDGQMLPDRRRIGYFREHLERVVKAIRASIPVEAYFAWTLLDNFEWEHGYRPESSFGLVHVDRNTLDRTPKASAAWYGELARTGQIPEPF
jgi:beta-glucosidase